MVKYPAGALQADAQYTPALRALYQGNPWIEALPDSLFDADLFHALHKKIPYHANERTLDCHTRKECIQALPHVFIPMGKTGEIARKIDAAIREGYVGRNPLDSCWNRQMGQLQSCIHHRDSSFISIPGYNARASGFCLVGDSGMGKTSTINHSPISPSAVSSSLSQHAFSQCSAGLDAFGMSDGRQCQGVMFGVFYGA